MYNSAHVGIAWTYHFIGNYGTDEELDLCGGMEACRNAAFEEFLYDTKEDEAITSYDADCMYFEFCCDDKHFLWGRGWGG